MKFAFVCIIVSREVWLQYVHHMQSDFIKKDFIVNCQVSYDDTDADAPVDNPSSPGKQPESM